MNIYKENFGDICRFELLKAVYEGNYQYEHVFNTFQIYLLAFYGVKLSLTFLYKFISSKINALHLHARFAFLCFVVWNTLTRYINTSVLVLDVSFQKKNTLNLENILEAQSTLFGNNVAIIRSFDKFHIYPSPFYCRF